MIAKKRKERVKNSVWWQTGGGDEEEVHAAERWGIRDLARLRHPGSSPGTYNN